MNVESMQTVSCASQSSFIARPLRRTRIVQIAASVSDELDFQWHGTELSPEDTRLLLSVHIGSPFAVWPSRRLLTLQLIARHRAGNGHVCARMVIGKARTTHSVGEVVA